MTDDRVELLVTVVLAAEGERAARAACRDLVWQVDGRIVESADCSAEEPGCWSVTLRVPSEERATHNVAAPLARAVRQFVRGLGPDFVVPTVSCEPPTAWTVLDDPDAVESLASGAERLLVEAWYGGDPYPAGDNETQDENQEPQESKKKAPEMPEAPRQPARRQLPPTGDPSPTTGCRLTLRVDVATSRVAGAQWQARALASRISRTATVAGVTEHDGVLSVLVDLGTAHTPVPQTVLTAVSALDRPGWSALRWEGDTALTTWTANPRPESGITELELSSSPDARRRRG
ncbi:MAG TPA: hypothetical protein VF892_15735 [Pseudonocardiaceae bacterium]|nr:hypothetical protein [Pseudonocardiaceae bacterium]